MVIMMGRSNLERENVGVGDSANIKREPVGVEEGREDDVDDVGVQGGDEADVEDVGVQEGDEADVEDINLEDVGVEGGDEADVEDINVEDVNRLTSELSDYLSSDSDLGDIPSEDGSDVDEELRAFRQERRKKKPTKEKETKKQEKKGVEIKEVPVGVASCVDRGFGDIGNSKATKYSGKLGGDEEYIDSSDYWSEDSEEIDVDVVRRVDLPRRRRSKKTRYNENCDFIVKNYNLIHKCIPLNKNKMCDSKLVSRKFKDRIAPQPYIRIWEIQGLVREVLGLYVGKTIYYRAKQIVMRENMGDWKLEFARLCDYADMIKRTNPESSCWIKIDKETDQERTSLFISMCAFMPSSKDDLNLGTGEGLTVMLDQQKGVVPVLMYLLPNTERRMCARHIWSNWPVHWRGEERRKYFWRCAKASFEVKFREEMQNEIGNSNSSQPSCHPEASWNPPPQSSSICGDTSAMARHAYTQSQTTRVSSVAGRGQGATGRGQGAAGRGKGCSGRVGGSGSGQFGADRGGYKRPATGFGVYSDPTTGTHVYNPGTSSERVLYGGINLRNASPTNIDIGFKPSGLKWNGKDAVTTTQLQQMKANKRKKVETSKSSSSIGSSKK
ncbi:putative protein NLP7-like [Capsicum annuum]|nr:putative protein NLP7-like [Capsicum annuum]